MFECRSRGYAVRAGHARPRRQPPHPRARGARSRHRRGDRPRAGRRRARSPRRGRSPRAPRTAPWARTAPEARGSLLKAAARRLREHARELAALQTREAGTPLADSLGGVEAGIARSRPTPSSARWTAARPPRGDLVLRDPRGVVAILMPWCDPLAADLRRARRRAGERQRGRAQAVREGAAGGRADRRAARPRRRSCSSCTATSAPRGR